MVGAPDLSHILRMRIRERKMITWAWKRFLLLKFVRARIEMNSRLNRGPIEGLHDLRGGQNWSPQRTFKNWVFYDFFFQWTRKRKKESIKLIFKKQKYLHWNTPVQTFIITSFFSSQVWAFPALCFFQIFLEHLYFYGLWAPYNLRILFGQMQKSCSAFFSWRQYFLDSRIGIEIVYGPNS